MMLALLVAVAVIVGTTTTWTTWRFLRGPTTNGGTMSKTQKIGIALAVAIIALVAVLALAETPTVSEVADANGDHYCGLIGAGVDYTEWEGEDGEYEVTMHCDDGTTIEGRFNCYACEPV